MRHHQYHAKGWACLTTAHPSSCPVDLTDTAQASYNSPIMWATQNRKQGFTIVEIIIVIVVVGILAGVTVVSYRGSQQKALFGAYKSDIVRINEAIMVYNSQTGRYPLGNGSSASGCVTNQATGTGNFISGLAPSYINPMPTVPGFNGGANYYAYCWNGSGAEYKIVRLVPSGTVPSIEQTTDVTMDPYRGWRGWGFWSSGGSML